MAPDQPIHVDRRAFIAACRDRPLVSAAHSWSTVIFSLAGLFAGLIAGTLPGHTGPDVLAPLLVPASTRSETHARVSRLLRDPARWGDALPVTYHQPGAESVALTPERHPNALRVTLPELRTWGIIEVYPTEE